MRAFPALFIFAFLLSAVARGENKIAVEQYVVIHHTEGAVPETTLFFNHEFGTGRHGAFFFGRGERLRSNNHGDAIAGWSYEPLLGVRFGFGAGMHDISPLNRVGMMLSVEKRGASAFAVYEGGHGRPWHSIIVNSPTWHRVGARFMSETHLGSGLGGNFKAGHVMLWGAYLFERAHDAHDGRHADANNTVFGMNVEHEFHDLKFWRKGKKH